MAFPSTEVNRFRDEVTTLIQDLRRLDSVLAIVEDHGVDDATRQAFFAEVFDPVTAPDITWVEFALGVVALRNLRTARDTNKLALAKLLR